MLFRASLRACIVAGLAAPALLFASETAADEGWVITSFNATYAINPDGTVDAIEDIHVDFLDQQRHGIFRDIPVEYAYDGDYNRLIRLTNIRVDDGSSPHEIQVSDDRPVLRIRIGDPDVLVTGPQRYRIHYTINRGLNPFPDHDEFYWNVTGNDWPVPIETSSVRASVPAPGIQRVACFRGAVGSTQICRSGFDASSASAATGFLGPGEGTTVVVALEKGVVVVGQPELVDADETTLEQARDFFGLRVWSVTAAAVLGVVLLALILRQWWIAGRDRWYGDMTHAGHSAVARRKPLLAHETIVTQFTPPEIDRRRLRPAEIGLLVDERADTLDVTATIIDLAVRGYLSIEEREEGGVLGLFKTRDYHLYQGKDPDSRSSHEDRLLGYEKRLLRGLFGDREETKLSDLKTHFYEHLAKVKGELVDDMTKSLRYFPRSPEQTRMIYRIAGGVLAGCGVAMMLLLGALGAGVVAVPAVGAGALLFLLAPLMPSRTADGRQMYRRCLGFRRYIETAETERQAFAERANLFEQYLPYAIVFECVTKWAKAFERLGAEATRPSWYSGRGPFIAAHFASSVNDFSQSISSVMASTPGGSGDSGFGGGGFSGGGGGGGGGGSW